MAGYIEQRRNGFYAVVEVPPSLREAVGRKRLRKTLATSDKATAKARVWKVVAELKAQIEAARHVATGDAVKDEARTLRTALSSASRTDEEGIREHISDRADEIRGGPVGDTRGVPSDEFDYEPEREKRAESFYQLASGLATPLEDHLERWLLEVPYTLRTQADHRRAIKLLKAWPEGHLETLEAVTQKKAGEFVSWLLRPRGKTWTGDRKTAAKYKSSLSSYWAFLKGKGLVTSNPWADQTIAKPKANLEGLESKEREFSEAEMLTLLSGPADQMTADLIRMAALSGMRIDELCRLTVGTVEGDLFRVTKGKTDASIRSVPIHPDLKPIVERRSMGKAAEAYLFDELKAPREGSASERSMPAVKRFGRYMRKVKVEVMLAGKRRSLVNFHSFRRWFITQAERAGQPESIIAAVVGHERQGMTLGVYSGGPSGDQYRACVEAVKLPLPPPPLRPLEGAHPSPRDKPQVREG